MTIPAEIEIIMSEPLEINNKSMLKVDFNASSRYILKVVGLRKQSKDQYVEW